jgi:sugar-specific transcriptional regulator TrmB
VLKIFKGFEFSRAETEVYVYLAKNGSSKGRDLAIGLRTAKQRLYPILNNLQEKGIVTRTPETPTVFTALTFEELLDLYVRLNMEQAQLISETKVELLADWRDDSNQEKT